MKEEPIWIKRMAVAFDEWAKRAGDFPLDFSKDVPEDYDYICVKYFDSLLRELDKAGKLPTVKKEPRFVPYLSGTGHE